MVDEYSDEELEEISERISGWFVEFSESKYFEELTEEQKKEAEFAVKRRHTPQQASRVFIFKIKSKRSGRSINCFRRKGLIRNVGSIQ